MAWTSGPLEKFVSDEKINLKTKENTIKSQNKSLKEQKLKSQTCNKGHKEKKEAKENKIQVFELKIVESKNNSTYN